MAGRRGGAALETERRHGDLPAVVDTADDVLLRAANVGEEHLVELLGAVDLPYRPDLDSLLPHGHQQVRDPGVLGHVGVGPGQQEDVVGVLGLGGPDLLAVDDPLVSVELGPRLERGQVGAGIRLAETLAPGDLPLEDPRDELLLLLLGAPLQQRWPDERVAEEVGAQRRPCTRELLVEDYLLQEREAFASVLRRPAGADPAAAEELRRPLLVELLALLRRHGEVGITPRLGQVLRQPSLDHDAEFLRLRRVRQVHRRHAIPASEPVPSRGRRGSDIAWNGVRRHLAAVNLPARVVPRESAIAGGFGLGGRPNGTATPRREPRTAGAVCAGAGGSGRLCAHGGTN